MRSISRNFLILFLVMTVIMGVFSLFSTSFDEAEIVSFDAVVQKIADKEVESIDIESDKLTITLISGEILESQKEPSESLSALLNNYGVEPEQYKNITVNVKDESGVGYWIGSILPFLIPFLFIALFLWFMMRQAQGANSRAMSFGQSQARDVRAEEKKKQITFKNVAGVQEAKVELLEVVEFLKSPKKFLDLGAKIPKGALLIGPPGTGKTLLARAVAGEADVPFFNISGSEFVEMFVGVGAARVRDLFKRAKKSSPCIIFIDEIDAVGRQRGAGLGGSHDEREQTLNQILVEMDGFDTHTNVIVLAATNRPDVLDPALLRPGRFDRRVTIDMPDIADREAILKVHVEQKPLAKDVNLRTIAQRTPGFTGADLANLLNEAAILTARRNKRKVTMDECLNSIEKVLLGPERKSHVFSKKEKRITAYHEAGHALVSHILPNTDPVRKVSIVSRGRAGGFTLKLPSEDKHLHSRAEFLDDIAVMLAGHATEKNIFKDVTTGASNDLKEATKLARQIVTEFGMSDKLGPRTYGQKEEMVFLGREIHERRDYSEHVAKLIDAEVLSIIQMAYETAKDVIIKMRPKLEEIVNKLLEKETIEQSEFESIFKTTPA
ncbi:ATP-dependent zinc metalloprotease FtsH [Patescibacteria group bacterium]